MGAIGEDGVRIINEPVVRMTGVTDAEIDAPQAREATELARRAAACRGSRPRLDLTGRVALIVDDGIATGSTVRAACKVARAHGAARVVVATPVAPPETLVSLRDDADEVIALHTPERFFAIGQFYGDFEQTSDAEVMALLDRAAHSQADIDLTVDPLAVDAEVEIPVGDVRLPGHLRVPEGAEAIVVFAHGSGSSRTSPRNRYVATVLERAGFGTLLFDLLTAIEERDRANVFDIELLADRLRAATEWLRARPEGVRARIGYFGASTGAGAALWAASDPDTDVAAVVSRGGRPDLAAPRLAAVRAPTLLVVGGNDSVVLELNREAQGRMRCESHLSVVPGASHLFEEPGTLDQAAELARDWFVAHLGAVTTVR